MNETKTELPRKREATPIELAALLMDAVCGVDEKEEKALRQLGDHLGVSFDKMRSELLYLKAFTVDFATAMALGESPERKAILDQYYHYWEQIEREAGAGLMEELQRRLRRYSEAIEASETDPAGLKGAVGRRFARWCWGKEAEGDLTMLGGAMFGALFEEVVDLLQEVDIVLYDFFGKDRELEG